MKGIKRFIPSRIHGIMDYALDTIVGISPLFVKGLKRENEVGSNQYEEKKEKISALQIIPYSVGIGSLIQSLFTNYKPGAVKKIPMKIHLAVDTAVGAFLTASPFLFGFKRNIWAPFISVGMVKLASSLFTKYDDELYPGKGAVMEEYM